jgi:hypothetical protein
VRPLVVIANMFPKLSPMLLRRLGYTATLEQVAATGIE